MPLKVTIEDDKDLESLSALLQDAIVRVGDIAFLRRAKRLALVVNRFCWEDAPHANGKPPKIPAKRVTCAVQFGSVLAMRAAQVDQSDPEALLYLLAMRFEPGVDGAGILKLVFAGGPVIAADVECLDGLAADQGEPWLSENLPDHGLLDGGPAGAARRP